MSVVRRLISVDGTSIYNLTSVDFNGDLLRFTLEDDSTGPFSVSEDGHVFVNTSKGWLNFEDTASYTLRISLQEVREASQRVTWQSL